MKNGFFKYVCDSVCCNLCPAVSGFAGCNEYATNSVFGGSGADFPTIFDQATCQSKCAQNADCTAFIIHPTHGCALYKTLNGCTGNYGWTGYEMDCAKYKHCTDQTVGTLKNEAQSQAGIF